MALLREVVSGSGGGESGNWCRVVSEMSQIPKRGRSARLKKNHRGWSPTQVGSSLRPRCSLAYSPLRERCSLYPRALSWWAGPGKLLLQISVILKKKFEKKSNLENFRLLSLFRTKKFQYRNIFLKMFSNKKWSNFKNDQHCKL
jgi:hypothetical protein